MISIHQLSKTVVILMLLSPLEIAQGSENTQRCSVINPVQLEQTIQKEINSFRVSTYELSDIVPSLGKDIDIINFQLDSAVSRLKRVYCVSGQSSELESLSAAAIDNIINDWSTEFEAISIRLDDILLEAEKISKMKKISKSKKNLESYNLFVTLLNIGDISTGIPIDELSGMNANERCNSGGTDFKDINSQTRIVVRDQKNRIVASKSLGFGRGYTEIDYPGLGTCEFISKVTLKKSNFYQISIGKRFNETYSFQDLKKENWILSLTIS